MAVKLRMQRHGSKKKPFYFIVAANSTAPRDGRFIEKLGIYNPLTVPAKIDLDRERALYWLQTGATPTHTVRRILSFKGVLYKKHLLRGVKLGLFDEAAAEQKFEEWIKGHEELVAKREEEHKTTKQEKRRTTTEDSLKIVEEKKAAVKKAEEEEIAKKEAEKAAAEVEGVKAENADNEADKGTETTEAADKAEGKEAETAEAESKKEDTKEEKKED